MVNTIQLLRDMIAIPSVNPMTTNSSAPVERAMGNFIETILTRAGIDCERQQVAEGRDNVVGIVHGNSGSAGVMLNSHMDTVPIDNMAISPFDPTIKNGHIYGRGSCDAKASIAAMLTAVINYAQQSDRPATAVFAAMVDDEFSFSGSWKLIEKQWPVSACVIGEPTRLRRVIAHKGIVRWHISVEGLSAHGATPELGRNAVYDAARVTLALEEFARELSKKEPHHLLGQTTLNVGRISGGHAVNIVNDRCELESEMRLLPNTDGKRLLEECLAFVRARVGPEVRLTFAEPFLLDPAMETPDDALIVTSLGDARQEEVGDAGALEGASYGTDGSKLARAGIQTVICGPGDIAQAHTDSEFVEIEQVECAARVYENLLSNWSLSGQGAAPTARNKTARRSAERENKTARCVLKARNKQRAAAPTARNMIARGKR
jgi:acetylornithine deacetylase